MDTAMEEIPAVPGTAPGLGLLCASLLAMPALADFCFWRERPRLSVGLFAVGAAGLILLNRPRERCTRPVVALLALICGAAVESAIDLCFSNVLVLIALTLALAGETYYGSLKIGWSRWSEAMWTILKTPGRWLRLMIELAARAGENTAKPAKTWRKAVRIIWIAVPGLAVTAIFAVILGNGNALFAKFADDWTTAICNWFLQLDLSFWRCFLWGFVTVLALPLLWPSPPPKAERFWTREIPRLAEITTARTARLQSVITLALLNALFCGVNTIDAVYLWAGRALPAGVNPSVFVHQGVSSLIMAVIFSGILLAGMFHQARAVSRWTPLRLLGLLWIGQNLVMLAGVFLRVKLYVDALDLTVVRVNLVFFLLLVTAGFILLAIHVWRQRSLGWLLHSNMLATFCLFYTVQFLDTAGFVSRYNVNLWLNSPRPLALDLSYLRSLGPPAFEAIETVANSGAPEASDAADYLKTEREQAQEQLGQMPWASWQLRDSHCQRKLLTATRP